MTEKNNDKEEENTDPLLAVIRKIRKDPKFEELRQGLMVNYVFMPCFNENANRMAFNEGMREMAAMVCGLNDEVEEWQKKTTG